MDDVTGFGSTFDKAFPTKRGGNTGLPHTFTLGEASASISELLFTVAVLVLSTGAFMDLLPGDVGIENIDEGKVVAQLVWIILYLGILFLARKRVKEVCQSLWQQKSLLLLLSWAVLSVVWSIDRRVTIRHSVALLATSAFAAYFGVRYELKWQLRLVTIALTVVLISSMIACIFFPDYGVGILDPRDEPGWQGVLGHRGALARLTVLMTMIVLLYLAKGAWRLGLLVLMPSLFALVVLTQSKTSLVYFVLSLCLIPLVRACQTRPTLQKSILGFGLLFLAVLVSWAWSNWEEVVAQLGRDPGMSGRVVMWGLSIVWIAAKPVLGYGFDGFWSDYYGPAADFRAASGWLIAPNAHNGFINLWLDLGVVGVMLFAINLCLVSRRAIRLIHNCRDPIALWPICFLAFLFVYSLSELSFLVRNDLFWILYVSVVLGTARATQVNQPLRGWPQ